MALSSVAARSRSTKRGRRSRAETARATDSQSTIRIRGGALPRLFSFGAYHERTVHKLFVGHVRFAADGAPEFATGWNDVDAPKSRISVASHPSLRASRWWFDAYATSNRAIPFAIE